MTTWAEFEAADPRLAEVGRQLLYRSGRGGGLLATIREGDLPRIHPISVAIVGGRLHAFILRSAKRQDLELDGRYALHAHQDPKAPSEFLIRGRARPVDDATRRSAVAAEWYFETDETYRLFEFSIESALLGARNSSDDWPPRYTAWTAAAPAPEAAAAR
jgi:dipeptidyl aminopeptidase/acylaminoacyl peptidase